MKKITIIFSLVLFFLCSFVSSCFAATTYPSIETVIDTEYYAYVIYELPDGNITARLIKSNDEHIINNYYFRFNDVETNFYGKLVFSNVSGVTVTAYQYILKNGVWVYESATQTPHYTGINFDVIENAKIYESSKDIILVSDGTVFFPLTLPEMGLLETTMEMITLETPEVGTKVVGVMKILLVCGVGCLALLMALPLLSRVFYRYRR